jgi:hypothetical protein
MVKTPKRDKHAEAIRRCEQRYHELRLSLAEIGFIWPGTVVSKKLACGKPHCICHKDPEARHGPYWYWSSKKGGKTVSRKMTEQEAALIVPWIRNRRQVAEMLKQMGQISAQMLELLLPASARAARDWPELPGRKGPAEEDGA